MRTLLEFCQETHQEDLLREWDSEANAPLTPEDVPCRAKAKAHWRCQHGHTWSATISSRTSINVGCPYCAGKKIWPGFNDFATRQPELEKEWHPTKNGDLKPGEIAETSHQPVWWQDSFGHEWRAQIFSRTRLHSGCPYCANRMLMSGFNDLATRFPALAEEWDEEKNGVPAREVLPGRKKVWWRCSHGHSWQAEMLIRTSQGTGCPVCAGRAVEPGANDLKTRFPNIAAQWNYERNRKITPETAPARSCKKVWWRCERGHEWQSTIAYRTTQQSECPYCSGRFVLAGDNDLATEHPEIAAQWNMDLNGALRPSQFTSKSSQMIWWRCQKGHVWRARISGRTAQSSGCPSCAAAKRRRHTESDVPHAEL